jgi:hypothetical protein
MDCAGHPTIGTGFVLLHEAKIAAGIEHVCLEENVGPSPDPGSDGRENHDLAANAS